MTTFQQLIGSLAELAVKAHGPTLKINKDDIFLSDPVCVSVVKLTHVFCI